MSLVRTALWLREAKNGRSTSSNGSKSLLAVETARIEERQLGLLARVVDMTDAMRDQQREDRAKWAPALKALMEGQQSMARVLNGNAKMLEEHEKHTRLMWDSMIDRLTSEEEEES